MQKPVGVGSTPAPGPPPPRGWAWWPALPQPLPLGCVGICGHTCSAAGPGVPEGSFGCHVGENMSRAAWFDVRLAGCSLGGTCPLSSGVCISLGGPGLAATHPHRSGAEWSGSPSAHRPAREMLFCCLLLPGAGFPLLLLCSHLFCCSDSVTGCFHFNF